MSPEHSLQTRLQALAKRVLAVGAAAAVAWAVLAAIAVWLLLAWLDLAWELSPQVRIAVSAIAVVVGVAALCVVYGIAKRASLAPNLARRLDRVASAGGEIVAGYDLASQPPRAGGDLPLTSGLAAIAVHRAGAIAGEIPTAKAAPWRPLRAPAGGVLAVAASVLLIALLLPRLALTEWLRFCDPFGDHPPYSQVQFKVEPGDKLDVVYGQGLDVLATTTGPPVERVELVLRTSGPADGSQDGDSAQRANAASEDVLPMFPEPGGRWRTVLTRVTEPGAYFVRSGRSRSAHYQLGVITTPKLASVRFRVTPPAYTRRPPIDGPLPPGGLAGLPGARVEVWAKSNRPLSGGELSLVAKETTRVALHPTTAGADEVTGAFELRASGKFVLGVADVDGMQSSDKLAGLITLLRDESPFVRILDPPASSLATPEATLPVAVSGEDDYGIARVQLMRSLNDSRALPMDFALAANQGVRMLDGNVALPLSAYGLAPGDAIKMFARIEDNDPAGAKSSESPVVVVQIISQKQYEQMLRARQGLEMLVSKYQEAQRRLEAVAEEQDGLQKKIDELSEEAKDGALPDEMREQMKQMAMRLRREAREMEASAKEMLPFDLEKKLTDELAKLAKEMNAQAQDLEELGSAEKLSAKQLAELLAKLRAQREQRKQQLQEKANLPLEFLEKIYPLIEAQSRFVQLYQQQRDLAERLASLKGRDGEDDPRLKGRMRSLEGEQRRLREALADLLDDIENSAGRLPEDERLDDLRASSLKFVDDVRNSGAAEAMTDAETGLASFSGTQGHAGALRAADILEKFLSKCESQQGQGMACLKFQPQLELNLGDTVAQLLGEAGLPGIGKQGAGANGYSTRRSSLDNVGLFGSLPGLDQMARKSGRRDGPTGRSPAGGKNSPGRDSAVGADEGGGGTPRGAASAAVPVRYRGRVGAYFQRVADEGGEADPKGNER